MTTAPSAGKYGDVTIVYEDNHLLVAQKPPGVLSQADHTGDVDMLGLLKGYIAQKYQKPGNVYLGLVQRLDRPTGGLMVFARTSKAAARLSQQIRQRQIKKGYLCVCRGVAAGEGRLHDYLLKDEMTNTVSVAPPGTPGAREALLDYRVVATGSGHTLCHVELITGRAHQIRVQFANMGHPIWGDARYNPNAQPGQNLALFCHQLAFLHPVSKEALAFEALPAGRPWDWFGQT